MSTNKHMFDGFFFSSSIPATELIRCIDSAEDWFSEEDCGEILLSSVDSKVTAAEPILSVKRMVAKELDVPVHLQRLVFKGKTLADEQNLCDYNIGPDTKLHLVVRRPETDADTLSTARIGASTVLWDQTRTFLAKHFSPADADKVLQQFKKEFSSGVSNLSLDDIERIAMSRANSEVDNADKVGPSS